MGYAASAGRNCQQSTIAEGPRRQDDSEADAAKRDHHLTKAETVTVAAIERAVPALAAAYILIDRFQVMIRKTRAIELEPWITESKRSLIASFANGIASDKPAVHAAITQPWSNGQVEAQITKLKLVKRQMYGRAKLDLLQARLIGAR
jgi:transposase